MKFMAKLYCDEVETMGVDNGTTERNALGSSQRGYVAIASKLRFD